MKLGIALHAGPQQQLSATWCRVCCAQCQFALLKHDGASLVSRTRLRHLSSSPATSIKAVACLTPDLQKLELLVVRGPDL